MSPAIRRFTLSLGIAIVSLAAQADSAPAPALNSDETQAIALVNQWAAAWSAKDADKVLAFFDDHVQYRDDPFQKELKSGHEQLVRDVGMLLKGLTSMRIVSAYAVASDQEALVLVRRIDEFSLNGKQIQAPMAAYFRIKNGKILEWLDTPLKALPPPK
jgi:ketosteroid isomerase-like protein